LHEVVVVGGGPAGVTAALRARELGTGVALVERGELGGTCTNDGCVPTRVLAHAARLVRDAEQFTDYGLVGEPPEVDFPRLLGRVRALIDEVYTRRNACGSVWRLRGCSSSTGAAKPVSPVRTRWHWEMDGASRLRSSCFAPGGTLAGWAFRAASLP
jgi:pyruvate/2-oxoglutarate dehydrogenase complex dihydrolipoamide dehydrogenase (E3) component